MKKFISTVCCMLLIILGIQGIGHLVRPTDTDDEFKAIQTFHSLPENIVEVIVYGSSHAWKGLDPMEMYEEYGIAAYNYGCNWQHINTTSLFVQDSLRTQSPKVVLIETFKVGSALKDSDIVGEIFYTREIPNSDAKKRYLEQCFEGDLGRYLSYYVPLFAFHENWSSLENESFMKNCAQEDYLKTMGFDVSEEITPVEIGNPDTFEQHRLRDTTEKILNELVNECHKREIEIIFYTAPYEGDYGFSDAMKKYAEENDCQYINLYEKIDEMGLDCNTDFQDKGHLNNNGAKKVANYLGKYIVENYDVTDMRNVEGNIWEKNCAR